MRKSIICFMLLCLLCGCGENAVSNYSEKSETETIQYDSLDENIEHTEKENGELMDQIESNSECIEEKEDYTQKMQKIYSEIIEEATTAAEKKQILFNEIPWGSNLMVVRDNFQATTGITSWPKSLNSMLGIGIEFDERFAIFSNFNNIGGSVLPLKEINVAGYDVEYCMLRFSAIEKDGIYVLTDEDSALYSAQYIINPINCEVVKEDLKTKISSIYGEPDSIKEIEPYENATITNEYIYWYGANDTVLVLSSNEGNRITISYVWLGGEELLNAALDNAEKAQSESENEIYGNGDTSGL